MTGNWIDKWKNEADRNLRIILEEFGQLNADQLNYSSHIYRCSIIEIMSNLSKVNDGIIAPLEIRRHYETRIREFRISRTRMMLLEYSRNHRCRKGQSTGHPADVFELLKYQQHQLKIQIDKLNNADLNCRLRTLRLFRIVKLTVGESIEYLLNCQWQHITQARRILMLQ